jgi:hypothetical protein
MGDGLLDQGVDQEFFCRVAGSVDRAISPIRVSAVAESRPTVAVFVDLGLQPIRISETESRTGPIMVSKAFVHALHGPEGVGLGYGEGWKHQQPEEEKNERTHQDHRLTSFADGEAPGLS